MSLAYLICVLAALQTPVNDSPAASAPPQIAQFLNLCETTRRGAILQLEHELRKLKSAPTAERSAVRIAQLDTRLKELQSGRELIVPTISFPPQSGAIGRLPGDSCYVEQVISADEVLIRCHFRVPVTTVKNFRAYRDTVVQPVAAVVRGWTSPVAEGQDAKTQEIFEVVGRDRYATQSGGNRTVLILKPFNTDQLRPYLRTK
jgi:hypothetical protein